MNSLSPITRRIPTIISSVVLVLLGSTSLFGQLADADRRTVNSTTLNEAFSGSGTVKPDDVIEGMRQAYLDAATYQDAGVVSHLTRDGQPDPQLTGVSFKTYFKRPGRFRFEWVEDRKTLDLPKPFSWPGQGINIIWSNGTSAFKYWEPFLIDWGEPVEKEESLELAIAGATGVSYGSAHTVSALLMPDVVGFRVTELAGVSLLPDEIFEGTDCYVVRGSHPSGLAIDLWIAKNDLMLRKVREQDAHGTVQEEVRRKITINAPIDDATFNYVPTRKGLSSLGWTTPYLIYMLALGIVVFVLRQFVWSLRSNN